MSIKTLPSYFLNTSEFSYKKRALCQKMKPGVQFINGKINTAQGTIYRFQQGSIVNRCPNVYCPKQIRDLHIRITGKPIQNTHIANRPNLKGQDVQFSDPNCGPYSMYCLSNSRILSAAGELAIF